MSSSKNAIWFVLAGGFAALVLYLATVLCVKEIKKAVTQEHTSTIEKLFTERSYMTGFTAGYDAGWEDGFNAGSLGLGCYSMEQLERMVPDE